MNFNKLNIFHHNKIVVKDIGTGERNKNIFKQIKATGLLRVLGLGLSFLVIPYMLSALGKESFGIWATILSVSSWITIMDIGVGNGLRTKLAECFTRNEFEQARYYISTAYFSLTALSVTILVVFYIISNFLNWQLIFNTKILSGDYIKHVVLTVFIAVIANFILSLVNQIIYALQRSSLTSLTTITANLLLLIALVFFKRIFNHNMLLIAVVYGLTIFISNIVVSFLLFCEYKNLLPSIHFFKKSYGKGILNVGLKFFFIQIAGVIIFTTDSLIITQILGPAEVTAYNITLKVFSAIVMFSGLIMSPFWSAYTEAYIKGDFEWIRRKIKQQNRILVFFIIGIGIFTYFFNFLIKFWIKYPIQIPVYLPLLAGIYSVLSIWCNIYALVLSGINKIGLYAIVASIVGILNIPISIYLVKFTNMGSGGVLLGTIMTLLLPALINPIQVYYFIYARSENSTLNKILY